MIEFYEIKKPYREHWGERYFRYNTKSIRVMQVCASNGDTRKGKSNTVGIYEIQRATFFSNYMAYGWLSAITKEEYETQFNKAVAYLATID